MDGQRIPFGMAKYEEQARLQPLAFLSEPLPKNICCMTEVLTFFGTEDSP